MVQSLWLMRVTSVVLARQVLQESSTATVERLLAAKMGLREEVEAETAAREAQLASAGGKGSSGVKELAVPSLEELVAEKAEELLTKASDQTKSGEEDDEDDSRETESRSGSGSGGGGDVGEHILGDPNGLVLFYQYVTAPYVNFGIGRGCMHGSMSTSTAFKVVCLCFMLYSKRDSEYEDEL